MRRCYMMILLVMATALLLSITPMVQGGNNDLNEFYKSFEVDSPTTNFELDLDYNVGVPPTIFDVPITGEKFGLAVDLSGSMAWPSYKIKGPFPNIPKYKVTWVNGEQFYRNSHYYYKRDPVYHKWWRLPDAHDYYWRWELVQIELNKMVDALPEYYRFNAVMFGNSTVNILPPSDHFELHRKIVRDSQGNIVENNGETAKDFINNTEVKKAGTNMHAGIQKVLEMHQQLDTVFVISDGEPTVGPRRNYTCPDGTSYTRYKGAVMKLVTEQVRKKIVAVWVGPTLSGPNLEFMKKLANVPNPDGSLPDPNRPAGVLQIPGN